MPTDGPYPRWSGSDLASATNPENGTVTYNYDLAHHVLARTDAKGQQTQYSYDTYGRLTEVRHYYVLPWRNCFGEDTSQRWDYSYDTNPLDPNFPAQNTWGRLTAVSFYSNYNGALSYQYSYNQAGRVTLQRLQVPLLLPAPHPFNFDATYAWDNEGRMTSLGYPGNDPGFYGSVYAYAFDAMGRLSTMKENGVQVATAGYDWANHATSMTYDNFNESRTYDPRMMQLTHLTTKNGSPTVMDMTYGYTAGQNNWVHGGAKQRKDHAID